MVVSKTWLSSMIFPVKLCMSFGDFPASDVWWGLPLRSGYTPNDPPSPGTSPDRRFQRPGGVSPMIWFLAIGQQVGALGNYQFKRNISIFYVDCYPFISYIYISSICWGLLSIYVIMMCGIRRIHGNGKRDLVPKPGPVSIDPSINPSIYPYVYRSISYI